MKRKRPATPAQLHLHGVEPAPAKRRRGDHGRSLQVAGLFAGIGGIELGMARAGHEALLLCESDAAANAVLAHHFPGVQKDPDVVELKALPKGTNLVTAGFPCQDLSQAGQTKGIQGAKSGLVMEVFRLLDRQEVPLVLLENVPFMLQLARGKALEVIISELERLEYNWAYRVVDSRAFGLPQRRERVYFVAAKDEDPRNILLADDAGAPEPLDPTGLACGFYWTEGIRGLGWAVNAVPTLKGGSTIGIPSSPAIVMPDGQIVKPDIRDLERMQGFDEDWTKAAESVVRKGYRWKLVGNAVTVNVAKWLGDRFASPGRFSVDEVTQLKPGKPWPKVAWNVGAGRETAPVSAWPVREKPAVLHKYLNHRFELLSERATAGFLSRTRKASLHFPPGFLDAVAAHLARMKTMAAA
jgi:DNA (cytosine-5)-methyltransferase 1